MLGNFKKELVSTHSQQQFHRFCQKLASQDVNYYTDVKDSNSIVTGQAVYSRDSQSRRYGIFQERPEFNLIYRIYVKRKDYDKAKSITYQ